MKRLFAAVKIEPSEQFLHFYSQLVSSLKHERIKWVETENMHLTLKFFGETSEERIPAITEALSAATAGIAPFTLRVARTGIFGSRYQPRVVWLGIDPSPELQQLAAGIAAELQKAGWEPDRQNFVPHLTLGRIREVSDLKLFQEIIGRYREIFVQQQAVSELTLYESILRREGPLYLKVNSFELNGAQ